MTRSIISLCLLSFLCHLIIITAQLDFRYYHCFDDEGNYTANSDYHTNLNLLHSNLTSNEQIDYGFYNFSYGQNPDRVSAVGLCRGDVKPGACRSCLDDSTLLLPNLCANQKKALGGFDECMLRYSDLSILANLDDDFSIYMWNESKTTEVDKYNQLVSELLQRLSSKAAAGDSRLKFAAANDTGPNFQTVYGLVQCAPVLSEELCNDCLLGVISEIPYCCADRIGGRVIKSSCNIRYENYRFYDPLVESPQVSRPFSEGKRDTGSRTIVVIVVPIVVTVLMLFGLGYFLWRKPRKSNRAAILQENFGEESSNLKSLQFNWATIDAATNKFSYKNRIGKGGFGEVYKGVLSDGREIAVKRLLKNSEQGASEFKNEVLLIAKLQHRNLVTLLGFCLEEQEKILIYEYVPNKSLDFMLFDSQKQKQLKWPERFKILGGITRGLLYLHEHSRLKVIHRDLKPSNILLDNNMNPKISDFGLARIVAIDQDQGNTNRIVGTHGYMSPEYMLRGQFSKKSDIFSFGVIILEVISGKRNASSYESHLLTHAWKQWRDGTPLEILDPSLIESSSQTEVIKCVQIGLLCVQENPDDRPSMANIVSYLSNLSVEVPSPGQPGFLMQGRQISNRPTNSAKGSCLDNRFGQSSHSPRLSSINEMSKSEFLPR